MYTRSSQKGTQSISYNQTDIWAPTTPPTYRSDNLDTTLRGGIDLIKVELTVDKHTQFAIICI
jgi:hypothetical protein